MRVSSSMALISLALLIGCKTNGTPEPATDPGSEGPGLALTGSGGDSAPAVAVKAAPPVAEVIAQHGSLSYTASGGRSPFKSLSCTVSWREGGAEGAAIARIEPRAEGTAEVERRRDLTVPELEGALRKILVADPRAFPEASSPSRATDLHTYTLNITMMGKKHTVESYGLNTGVPLAEMIHAMDEACMTEDAIEGSRSGE